MSVQKYRKKPVVIEAIHNESIDDLAKILKWAGDDMTLLPDGRVVIHTLEDDMPLRPGDWVIKGVAGEFYPCKTRHLRGYLRAHRRAGNEGSGVTIDVAMLRELHCQYDPGFESTPIYCFSCMDNVMELEDAEWPCPTAELLDAYEERDRLRVMLKEIGNQAANINHHCYQTGKLQCVACASSQELIEELARAALEGRK